MRIPKMKLHGPLKIPGGLEFSELSLEVDPKSNKVLFASPPLGRLCINNGLDVDAVLYDHEKSCWLIAEWYIVHRRSGGAVDPVGERVVGQVAAHHCEAKTKPVNA